MTRLRMVGLESTPGNQVAFLSQVRVVRPADEKVAIWWPNGDPVADRAVRQHGTATRSSNRHQFGWLYRPVGEGDGW